jgi:hypothetical protein
MNTNPRLSRQIGYRPPTQEKKDTLINPEKKVEKNLPQKKQEAPSPQRNESGEIFNWLKEHEEFFKLNALCEKIGYNRSNFKKLMERGSEIPPQHLPTIIQILKTFGYGL